MLEVSHFYTNVALIYLIQTSGFQIQIIYGHVSRTNMEKDVVFTMKEWIAKVGYLDGCLD